MTKQAWRPSGASCNLPADTANIWKRLMALSSLSWPTLAEQVERRMLVTWLNPTESNAITDINVFDVACDAIHTSRQCNEEFLQPAYIAARVTWENICHMADGYELSSPRPAFSEDDDFDQWQQQRREQGFDWWETVMRELEMLLRMEVFYAFELPERTTCHEFARALRHDFLGEVFDGPTAIGASIYLEPSLPGTGLGFEGETLYVMESLAFAVHAAIDAMNEVDRANKEQFGTALMRVDFFWQLLKGYTWASAHNGLGTPLPGIIVSQPTVWEVAKTALIWGRDAINSTIVDGKRPRGFSSRGGRRSSSAEGEPTEHLIARMDASINEARQSREALKHIR